MSERAVMTTWMLGGQTSVYLHEDRLEIGTTDVVFNETLARVAYRDARRCVSWTATRQLHLWLGVGALLIGGVFGILAISSLTGGDETEGVLLGIFAAGGLAIGGILGVMGYPGGITKFRLEGARGHVEGVLSGSRKKREALLGEIERRIRDRQDVQQA